MDCEKFEASMLDELYGELDELTLAASKRHVGGCARCSALMAGFRATRKLVTLPVLAASDGFEERILAATRAAEARPKLGLAQVISWGGRWAMQPQTAMAAVFLLIVGTSSLLLSRHAPKSQGAASASFTVTENGEPAFPAAPPPAASGDNASRGAAGFAEDPRAAAAAHGTVPLGTTASLPKSAPTASGASDGFLEPRDSPSSSADPGPMYASRAQKAPSTALPRAAEAEGGGIGRLGGGGSAGGSDLGEVGSLKVPRAESASRAVAEFDKKAPDTRFAPPPPPATAAALPAAAPVQSNGAKDDDAFGSARRQYVSGNYGGAVRAFDSLAAAGDTSAALWAARSSRDGAEGCAVASARFDQVAQSAWGTTNGYDATLEGAQCYARLGQGDAARARYGRLLTVPAYAARAQSGINAMSQVASKRASVTRAASPPAKPSARPETAPATTPAAGSDTK